jgi:hypothetical protein
LAVLSGDYFSIPEEEIKQLESVLTIVGGRVVYAAREFAKLAPPELPVSPSWSSVAKYGGYARGAKSAAGASHSAACADAAPHPWTHSHHSSEGLRVFGKSWVWSLGCDCFAF